MTALDALAQAEEALAASGPFPLPLGALAPVVAGAVGGLSRGDWYVPGLRERAGAALRDVAPERIGDGSRGARPYRVAPVIANPASRALVAVGLALAEPSRRALVHLGTGSLSDGELHEALNLATLTGAGVIFLLASIDLTGAPMGPQAGFDPVTWARSFTIPVIEVDGTSVDAVRDAVSAATDGPQVIVARIERRDAGETNP